MPNSLGFAGFPDRQIEVIDVHRHAAEKFHGMLRTFPDRENTRVRDLVDLVILREHGLVAPARAGAAAGDPTGGADGRRLLQGTPCAGDPVGSQRSTHPP